MGLLQSLNHLLNLSCTMRDTHLKSQLEGVKNQVVDMMSEVTSLSLELKEKETRIRELEEILGEDPIWSSQIFSYQTESKVGHG